MKNFNLERLGDFALEKGIKFLAAMIILFIGLKLIKWVENGIFKALRKIELEDTLRMFLKSIIRVLLKLLLFLTVASTMGVEMTSFIAMFTAAGFAIGLALQGNLANFAGGLLILLVKPFKVGDFIEAQSHSGTVKEIQIFHTVLVTVDNKKVIIPNGSLSNGSCINYSAFEERRVDMIFSADYTSDIDKVKALLVEIVNKHPKIFSDPKPVVRLQSLAASSIDFTVRVWCKTSDYWDVYYDITEEVKIRFDKEKIDIPYPHMTLKFDKEEKII